MKITTLLQRLCLALALSKSHADIYGGPASCAANPGCEHLGGNCCPSSLSGKFLSCCPVETTPASCSAHPGCASLEGLGGECCPSANGKDLYCCYQNAEALYKRDFTFYGHPDSSQNKAVYFASTGAHLEQDTNNGRIYTYERFGNFLFDLIYYQTDAIPNADDYVTGRKKFYLTIDSTNAPPCTEVLLQLDSLPDATDGNFPAGRHSRYLGTYTPDTSRFEFTFLDRPDPTVADTAVNSIALFFEPGVYASGTFQYSFLDSAAACIANADTLPVDAPVAAPVTAPVYPPPPPPTYAPVYAPPVYPPPPPPTYAPVYPPPPPPTYAPVHPPTHAPVHPPTQPPIAPGEYDPPSPSPPVMQPIVYFNPSPTTAPVMAPVMQPQSMTLQPIRDDPVARPQAMTNGPTMDDPVNRPESMPVSAPDDPVSRPESMPVSAPDDPVGRPSGRSLSDEPCLPPPVNQCTAYHVDAVCSGMDDETCKNPECASTPGCGGGMVTSYLALEDRSTFVQSAGSMVSSLMMLVVVAAASMLM